MVDKRFGVGGIVSVVVVVIIVVALLASSLKKLNSDQRKTNLLQRVIPHLNEF
jgi:hypothetical protein